MTREISEEKRCPTILTVHNESLIFTYVRERHHKLNISAAQLDLKAVRNQDECSFETQQVRTFQGFLSVLASPDT